MLTVTLRTRPPTVSTWTSGEWFLHWLLLSTRLTDRDHDEQTNVIEAVKKLNEVKGVRGIRRFFKQVAQSAKGADQDDFLGCITIPVQVKGILQPVEGTLIAWLYQDIPSSGFEGWYKLLGRSSRSQVSAECLTPMLNCVWRSRDPSDWGCGSHLEKTGKRKLEKNRGVTFNFI